MAKLPRFANPSLQRPHAVPFTAPLELLHPVLHGKHLRSNISFNEALRVTTGTFYHSPTEMGDVHVMGECLRCVDGVGVEGDAGALTILSLGLISPFVYR